MLLFVSFLLIELIRNSNFYIGIASSALILIFYGGLLTWNIYLSKDDEEEENWF